MKIGAAITDHIKTEKVSRRHYAEESSIQFRPFFLFFLLITATCTLLFKLINIQIVYGSYYRSLADTNRTRTNIIRSQRGIIFDRNGIPLVYNTPSFTLKNDEQISELTRDEAMKLLSENQKLDINALRYYPYKEYTSHVLGYTGQISKEELAASITNEYSTTDILGKSGIEKIYEKQLRGVSGKELIEVDALGNKVRTLGQNDPIPGKDITLTLDINLQKAAYNALPDGKKGVVIVSTPDGQILTMVSKPSFDANLFTMGDTYKATGSAYTSLSAMLNDGDNQPLMNRAITGTYPPGSTFKLVTAAAGLEKKIIDEKFEVEDTGILKVGAFSFGNWFFLEQGKTDGNVNVVKAISRSNDIFFYKLAEKVSVDTLSSVASEFGIGKTVGIDLPGEAKGILPTKEWKQKVMKEPWYLGDTYHYGIGQGYLLTTPLQVNSWTQVIANGGTLYTPHLIKNEKLKIKNEKFLSQKTIRLIRQGMIDSCREGGVAWPLFTFRIQNSKLRIDGKNFLEVKEGTTSGKLQNNYREVAIACKTGTAQHGGEKTEPHAWITLFAPAYDPQIVVTVLVEESGQGSNVAAPVAKKVLEEWFGK